MLINPSKIGRGCYSGNGCNLRKIIFNKIIFFQIICLKKYIRSKLDVAKCLDLTTEVF
jgi:hypothetical protein